MMSPPPKNGLEHRPSGRQEAHSGEQASCMQCRDKIQCSCAAFLERIAYVDALCKSTAESGAFQGVMRYTPRRAWSRSASKSSLCSMPMESRIVLGRMPASACSAAVIPEPSSLQLEMV